MSSMNCILMDDFNVFDLRSLQAFNPYKVGDYNIQFCEPFALWDGA